MGVPAAARVGPVDQELIARLRVRPPAFDVALAAAVFVLALFVAPFAGIVPAGLALVWAAGYALPLAWRRVAPDAAALGIVPAHLLQLLLTSTPVPGNISVPIALYAVAAYGQESRARQWLAGGLLASLLAGVRWAGLGPAGFRVFDNYFGVALTVGSCAAVVMAAWYMGSLRRAQVSRQQALSDRADALQRQQVQAVQLAATEERQRIAREMHDIVAHSLSIIVVQADGAHYVATEAPGPAEERLDRAASALETIQTTARSALAETRRLVGVLHSDDGADRAPAASLADLPALIAKVTETGRRVAYEAVGDPGVHPPLGPVGELTAYRVVQESLTNVMKHAGPDASARVRLTHRREGVTVTVRDDGSGATASDGQGHGLIGMAERVHALGGSLVTGNIPGGGFEVTAYLPADPADLADPTEPLRS